MVHMAESSRQSLTIRLNPERYNALRDEADTLGMSINTLLTQIVDEHFTRPTTSNRSLLVRSTYAGNSSPTTNSMPVQAAVAESVNLLADAVYEEALRRLGGNSEGGS